MAVTAKAGPAAVLSGVLAKDADAPDKLHEACGIFGVYAPGQDVANLCYLGLYALQHRGQESAGICTSDGEELHLHRDMGLVGQVFSADSLAHLPGAVGIGHTRYSTTGSSRLSNAQPFTFEHGQLGPVALAHNGNLTNTQALHAGLVEEGQLFETSSDSEVLATLLSRTPGERLEVVLQRALPRAQGASRSGSSPGTAWSPPVTSSASGPSASVDWATSTPPAGMATSSPARLALWTWSGPSWFARYAPERS